MPAMELAAGPSNAARFRSPPPVSGLSIPAETGI
jgi:hypothetical protein